MKIRRLQSWLMISGFCKIFDIFFSQIDDTVDIRMYSVLQLGPEISAMVKPWTYNIMTTYCTFKDMGTVDRWTRKEREKLNITVRNGCYG